MTKIGVDLGGTNIRAGLCEEEVILKKEKTNLREKDSLESTLQQLINLIKPLVEPSVTAMGVAVPSIVAHGIVYNVVNIPSWEKVPLQSILEKEFNLPVRVENDANCFALGEMFHGKARGHKNVVGVTLGTGVGGGVILNYKIFTGHNGGAGEIGYLNYKDRDFEFYGGSFFFEEIHHLSALEAFQRGKAGDPKALVIWEEYGKHIADLIKTILYAYDPEAIVFGGSISLAWELFESSMRKNLQMGFHFPLSMERLQIYQSENEDITLLGASSLVSAFQ